MVQQKRWEERYEIGAKVLFDLLWGDHSTFLEEIHNQLGNTNVVVTDWVATNPSETSYQRVCFYTLNEGEGSDATRCSELQRFGLGWVSWLVGWG